MGLNLLELPLNKPVSWWRSAWEATRKEPLRYGGMCFVTLSALNLGLGGALIQEYALQAPVWYSVLTGISVAGMIAWMWWVQRVNDRKYKAWADARREYRRALLDDPK